MPYSTCCGAYTDMEEYGICPDCKEHCDFEKDCDNCNGFGWVNDKEECPVCKGEGVIECKA